MHTVLQIKTAWFEECVGQFITIAGEQHVLTK